MVGAINLGNFFTTGGKSVFGGSATGLDTETLIGSLVEARRLPAVKIEENIENNKTKISALNELKTILTNFRSAVDVLRNPPGVGNSDQKLFQYRTASLSTDASGAAENYLSVTAAPGATIGQYDIAVIDLAAAKVQQLGSFADPTASVVETAGGGTAGMFSEGDLTITTPAGKNATVTLEDGDTLYDVANKFNQQSGQSGLSATVLKIADNNYSLILRSTDEGVANAYSIVDDGSGVLTDVGAFTDISTAQDASFTIDGVAITRSTNVVDDLINGITFTLKQETPALTSVEVEIEPDVDLISQGIIGFVDAYNELKVFQSKQSQRGDDGLLLEDSVLGSNATLRLAVDRIAAELSRSIPGLSDVNKLSQLGIKLGDFAGDEETPYTRNILTVDTGTLESALLSDYDAVRRAFEFTFEPDDANLQVFSRTNTLDVTSFTLNIDAAGQTVTADYLDSGGNPVNTALTFVTLAGGIRIEGQSGTPFEGLVMLYGQFQSDTVNVSVTQGFGDRLFNTIDELLDEDAGLLTIEIDSLTDQNERFQEDISRIDEQIEKYRDSLIEKFAALEAAISSVNIVLQTLQAQADARQANS